MDNLNYIIEKHEVLETINRLFIYTDKLEWKQVQNCFDYKVLFDMSSVTNEEAVRLTPQQITDIWDKGLKTLKAVHHQTGNFAVDMNMDEANVTCYGTAYHYTDSEEIKTFVGSYDFHLNKKAGSWKIDMFKFNLKFII